MSGRRTAAAVGLVVALVAAPPPVAHADDADDAAAARPAPDLPAPDDATAARREARTLFAAGNAHFENNELVRAVEAYRAALARWDRPIIHFNLAVALIELDRAREAVVHLERATGPDAGELGPRVAEARNYLRLLRARLSTLIVWCQAATACELDGDAVARPGMPMLLEAGTHTVVGRKPGFETWSQSVVLEPGATRVVTVAPGRARVQLARRWWAAGPWLAASAGVVVTLGGGTTLLLGNAAMARANRDLRSRCSTACLGVPDDLVRRSDHARLAQRLGAAGIAVGGTALVTGLVLSYLNQPRVVGTADHPRLGLTVAGDGLLLSVGGAL